VFLKADLKNIILSLKLRPVVSPGPTSHLHHHIITIIIIIIIIIMKPSGRQPAITEKKSTSITWQSRPRGILCNFPKRVLTNHPQMAAGLKTKKQNGGVMILSVVSFYLCNGRRYWEEKDECGKRGQCREIRIEMKR
jgi:hypothetical protein